MQLIDIMQEMSGLSTDELHRVEKQVNDLISRRIELRKKELWGNVVAAIEKYQNETHEQISIYCRNCGEDLLLDEIGSDQVGQISASP